MTPRQQHPNSDDGPFGTPATAASNDSATLATPQAEIVDDADDETCRAETTPQHERSSSMHAAISSDANGNESTPQTPPSPTQITAGTPPTPSSIIKAESPPTDVEGGNCVNSRLRLRRGDEFGTPSSERSHDAKDCQSNEAEFGTPTHETDETTADSTDNNLTTSPRQRSKHPKRKQQQLYLDLGQKSFASHKICPICSSLIVHGTKDSQDHDTICKSFKEGVICLGFKRERCVARFGEERILEIRQDDLGGRKKVEEVKMIADRELGFATTVNKDGDGSDAMTSYIYIAKKRIVGLLSVKRIERAYPLLADTGTTARTRGSISRSTIPRKAILGIHQIWVHRVHRHRSIGTKLVDAARTNYVFGMVVPVERIGFSSPTEEGVGFARGYVGEEVLVYDVC